MRTSVTRRDGTGVDFPGKKELVNFEDVAAFQKFSAPTQNYFINLHHQ